MNPNLKTDPHLKAMTLCTKPFIFDSDFESGNLDMVIQTKPRDFELYMRVDTNSRGHHQWFYFSVQNQNNIGNVNFSILNFTKSHSLYHQGMRICVKEDGAWQKSGNLISYKPSRLNDTSEGQDRSKRYYELNFSYEFKRKDAKVYFAYCFPYTFSRV